MKAPHHLWSTADGRLVKTGDPDAETLVYPTGHDIPDDLARELGLADGPEPEQAAEDGDEKAKTPAATKTRKPSASK